MSSLYNPNLLYPAKLNANFEIMNVQLFFFSGFFGRFTIGVTLASILNFVPNIPLEENSNQKLVQIRKTIEYRLSRTTRSRFQFSIDPRPTLSRVFQRGKIPIIGKERFGEEEEPLSFPFKAGKTSTTQIRGRSCKNSFACHYGTVLGENASFYALLVSFRLRFVLISRK